MARIEPIEVDRATGKAEELLDELAGRGGEPWRGCEYCLVAHTRAARQLDLSDADIELARKATASDRKIAAMVGFGQQVIAGPGEVTDAQIDELHGHGYTNEQIAEVVGLVALQLLTGGLNLVAGIEPAREDIAELTPPENRMSMTYLSWAAAVGAAGCGRCVNAV